MLPFFAFIAWTGAGVYPPHQSRAVPDFAQDVGGYVRLFHCINGAFMDIAPVAIAAFDIALILGDGQPNARMAD